MIKTLILYLYVLIKMLKKIKFKNINIYLIKNIFFNKLIKKKIINLYTVIELRLIDRQRIFLNIYIFLINYKELN